MYQPAMTNTAALSEMETIFFVEVVKGKFYAMLQKNRASFSLARYNVTAICFVYFKRAFKKTIVLAYASLVALLS